MLQAARNRGRIAEKLTQRQQDEVVQRVDAGVKLAADAARLNVYPSTVVGCWPDEPPLRIAGLSVLCDPLSETTP